MGVCRVGPKGKLKTSNGTIVAASFANMAGTQEEAPIALDAAASSEVKDDTQEKEKATVADPEAVTITDPASVDSFSHQVVTTATSNSEDV
uniref:Uncharacterized protein n=1 Tax=Cannabis sativa TaxID=3483 RepID=A0A803PZ79_CANSA